MRVQREPLWHPRRLIRGAFYRLRGRALEAFGRAVPAYAVARTFQAALGYPLNLASPQTFN
jgi:hypothetical protein